MSTSPQWIANIAEEEYDSYPNRDIFHDWRQHNEIEDNESSQ